jgi:cytochrome c biogenesis factor
MTPELGTIFGAILLIAFIAIVFYFRSDEIEKDTYQVEINDAYFRRLFVPLMITLLIFVGVFLIIRGGSPGIDYSTAIKF